MVNVLEVPTEAAALNESLPNAASSSIESTVFTLDPHQKYRALKPLGCKLALTKSDVTSHKSPSGQIRTQVAPSEMQRLAHENKPFPLFYQVPSDFSGVKDGGRPTSSGLLSRRSTLMTIFHRVRGTRSAGYSRGGQETHSPRNSGGESFGSVPGKPVSFERAMENATGKSSVPASHASSATPTTLLARPQALKPRCAESVGAKIGTESHQVQELRVPAGPKVSPNIPLRYDYQITPLGTSFEQGGLQCADQSASPKVSVQALSHSLRLAGSHQNTLSFRESHDASNDQTLSLLNDEFCRLLDGQGSRLSNSSNARTGKASTKNGCLKQCSSTEPPNDAFSTSLGYRLSSNGSSSPLDLSELDLPLSPCVGHRYKLCNHERNHDDATINDEEHARAGPRGSTQVAAILPTAAAKSELFSSGCFSEHNLAPVEQASALTAKLSQKAPYTSRYSTSTFLNNNARTDRILVWRGESKHHLTATEELADDLGYLGEVII